MRAAPMTRTHGELRVGAHVRLLHRDLRAVGEQCARVVPVHLDETEDVVPAPAVETDRVIAQLVQDFVHLERRGQRLDQHGRADRPERKAERLLRVHEHLVPDSRLAMALELR
jgi:hypothetical protein